MAIISAIGRRSLSVRTLILTIYVVLAAGGVTMVYPFLLMLAGSTKSNSDAPDGALIPRYLVDDQALYQKAAEARFNESLERLRVAYRVDAASFATLPPMPAPNPRLADAWERFCSTQTLPFYTYMLGEMAAPASRGVLPLQLRRFKAALSARYDGDIQRLNRELGSEFLNWNAFAYVPEEYLLRRSRPGTSGLDEAFRAYKAQQPIAARYYFSAEGFYRQVVLRSQYGKDLAAYNASHGTQYATWDDVHLDRRLPDGPGRTDKERADWLLCVRELLSLFWLRADAAAAPAYQQFLAAKYGSIDGLNRNYHTTYADFTQVPLIVEPPLGGLPLSDWDAFLRGWKDPLSGTLHQLPATLIYLDTVDTRYRDWVAQQYGTLEAANRALGTAYSDWRAVLPPQRDLHDRDFLAQRAALRWEFTTRNYVSVWDYIVRHGRGVFNTVVYCLLAILGALVVNPLAAYALSRYRPPSTYKVLLFLMLTMAFPQMVTQIPMFLMLRELHLLNSFWALLLPGLANGYSIFLLKGFFDSLPRELYESAALDGAGEIRIFLQLTMSLSKPILAVIALSAFAAAYENFMMALLICQDERMWTLMPWLYQLQQRSFEGVVMASLLIAAIPTFVVFSLCQNVIMKGIVVPVEK